MTDDAIRRELADISSALAVVRQVQQEQGHNLRYLRGLLAGDGQGHGGLVLRTDRLEQAECRRTWWIRGIVVAVLGVVADVARRLFGG